MAYYVPVMVKLTADEAPLTVPDNWQLFAVAPAETDEPAIEKPAGSPPSRRLAPWLQSETVTPLAEFTSFTERFTAFALLRAP